ncbi:MAG: hypothetical protein KHY89_04230 [Butyricicoccus pullicaecorum]|nr:hypothetical protein [Butyricicoccus pullicaecorum]
MQNRLTVSIAGQKFSLVADEPEPYMKEIAALADQKVAEAKRLVGNTAFATGVLATLNMADEAVKMRHECEKYRIMSESQQIEIAKQQEELGRVQEELETLRHTRPDKDPAVLLTEIHRLEKELEETQQLHQNVCAESDAEMARLNEQIETLIQECDKARADMAQNKVMTGKLNVLTQENETLRAALRQARIEKENAVKEQTSLLEQEIARLRASLETSENKAQQQAQETRKQMDSLQKENEELRSARVCAEPLYTEIRSLQAALDAKEAQVRENSTLKNELDKLKEELKRSDPAPFQTEIKALKKALDEKEKQLAQQSGLKEQIETLRNQLKQNDPEPLYAEIRQLQAALNAKHSQAEENNRLKEDMQKLRDSYQDVCPKVEYNQLSEELEKVKKEFSKARIQLAGREIGEIGELRRELTRLRDLEKDYNAMQDPEQLREELAQLRKELREANEALAQANESLEDTDMQAEIKRLKAELNRQIQINQSRQIRDKKKKGGK